jgi:16S rRNA (cytidine1402-2'-O)-methyltransferase
MPAKTSQDRVAPDLPHRDGAAAAADTTSLAEETRTLPPGLYIVATPIGNAEDLTFRARRVLAGCDLLACEDTRVTAKLLTLHGLKRPMLPYHEHNAARMRPELLARLRAGATVALVSDAGTPLISDPGYRLVAEAREASIPVWPIPGPSAVMAALSVAGLPTDRFLFLGFLPPRQAARRAALAEIAGLRASLVIFESPRRLAASLADMAETLGARRAAVMRELTKKFEEVRRGSLPELAAAYAGEGPPKGEIVIVIGPPVPAAPVADDDLDARLRAALGGGSLREAAARVAAETGLPRRRVYQRALALAGKNRDAAAG